MKSVCECEVCDVKSVCDCEVPRNILPVACMHDYPNLCTKKAMKEEWGCASCRVGEIMRRVWYRGKESICGIVCVVD